MTKLISRTVYALAAIIICAAGAAPSPGAEPLPALGVDSTRISVSGLSSGGYMAGQFQVAYSKLVMGGGIVAGGPYACAQTPGSDKQPVWLSAVTANAIRAQQQCMADGGTFFSVIPEAADLVAYAKTLEKEGKIDAVANLRNHKIYIAWGESDDKVVEGVVKRAGEFFLAAGVPTGNISYVRLPKAGHAFVTESMGLGCGMKGAPWLNACGYDQAAAILSQIYGSLKPAGTAADAGFVFFDQMGGADATLADAGMAYIPTNCRQHKGCGVHIVFHGCEQGGDAYVTFVKNSGYARWAESNRLIVLFPHVRASRLNPKGCWDWWGYTNRHFLERGAPQMQAVREMLDQLMAVPKS